ncbi:MAG: hypothetical protein R2794_06875 [Chitinophagales bacterium]
MVNQMPGGMVDVSSLQGSNVTLRIARERISWIILLQISAMQLQQRCVPNEFATTHRRAGKTTGRRSSGSGR